MGCVCRAAVGVGLRGQKARQRRDPGGRCGSGAGAGGVRGVWLGGGGPSRM